MQHGGTYVNKRDFFKGQASQLAWVGPDNLFQGNEWRCQMIKTSLVSAKQGAAGNGGCKGDWRVGPDSRPIMEMSNDKTSLLLANKDAAGEGGCKGMQNVCYTSPRNIVFKQSFILSAKFFNKWH